MVEFLQHNFTSAHNFLAALRLSNPEWWVHHPAGVVPDPQWQREWIFRGQGSAKWELLPAAWRKNPSNESETPLDRLKRQIIETTEFVDKFEREYGNVLFFREPPEEGELPEETQKWILTHRRYAMLQAFAEVLLVNEFIALTDELGFSVSPLNVWTRSLRFISNYYNLCFPEGKRLLDMSEYASQEERFRFWSHTAIALAQHHGITTRLLDWTRNPITAAFFAASEKSDRESDDQIVVYAFHKEMLTEHIRCIEVPSSNNDFLRAQSGLFTVDLQAENLLLKNGHYPSLEESVKRLRGNYKSYHYPQKLTLSVSEAPELMRLLWLERVTHAHLMPTLDHVAEAVLTKIRLSENVLDIR